ncbi:WD40-repeat-containing domain protein [Phycomyces nitens]|nr:WD40-repeat-containing domain protein [Phycomyces nitens]
MVDEPLEQPVNHVLKQYELLEITGLQDACTIKMTNTTPWRMNLCAASQVDTCIFYVAMDSSVYVYRRNYRKGSLGQPIKKIETKGASSQERDPWVPQKEYTINSIKVGQLLDKEVLATVAENGHVSVWLTEDLDKDPLVLQHEVASTWGLAIHRDGLLAVATNNKKITVFNVLQLTKSTRMFEDKDQKRERRNVLKEKESIDLIGHEHNIPTIDFSDSGKYIASCSIDRSCRIWDLAKEKTIAKRKTPITLPESLSW